MTNTFEIDTKTPDMFYIDSEFLIDTDFNVTYEWKPMEDITTYELALCVPALVLGGYVEKLPLCAKRHLRLRINDGASRLKKGRR